jgi:hypothetical protein
VAPPGPNLGPKTTVTFDVGGAMGVQSGQSAATGAAANQGGNAVALGPVAPASVVTMRPAGASANAANGANAASPNLPQGMAGAMGANACSCNCLCPAGSFNMGAMAAPPPPPAAAAAPPASTLSTVPVPATSVPATPAALAAMLPPPQPISPSPSAGASKAAPEKPASITVGTSVLALQSAVTVPLKP